MFKFDNRDLQFQGQTRDLNLNSSVTRLYIQV